MLPSHCFVLMFTSRRALASGQNHLAKNTLVENANNATSCVIPTFNSSKNWARPCHIPNFPHPPVNSLSTVPPIHVQVHLVPLHRKLLLNASLPRNETNPGLWVFPLVRCTSCLLWYCFWHFHYTLCPPLPSPQHTPASCLPYTIARVCSARLEQQPGGHCRWAWLPAGQGYHWARPR